MVQKLRVVLVVLILVAVAAFATAYAMGPTLEQRMARIVYPSSLSEASSAQVNPLPPECHEPIAEADHDFCEEVAEVRAAHTHLRGSLDDLRKVFEETYNAAKRIEDAFEQLTKPRE